MSNDTHDGAAPPEPFHRLKNLLREMFQLDRGDLDFGLYRIMAMKVSEIEEFLDGELLPQVQEVLAGVADKDRIALEEALAEARGQARQLGVDPDEAPRVRELQAQLVAAKADTAAEADVYSHLAAFFARYYNEGDFMSLRRYAGGGRTTYLIPYDGEEVKLHWANADQYYIKTTENYASYAFAVGEGETMRRVCFEIAIADNVKDNVKATEGKQRRFVLARGGDALAHDGADLVVRFEHRPLTDAEKKTWPGNGARQQERIDEASAARVLGALDGEWRALLAAPAPTNANPERTLLAKHIARYTAKNSFDYFIHKDLGGFLLRELDLYLKTEVLNLDDLVVGDADGLRRVLARMRAVRHVGEKIVAFLAQLEDFQKRLWLKKKFVLETQWCVTLDRVPEAFYAEIAANEAQRREWVDLFAIDESAGDHGNGGAGYDETLSEAFLRFNPHLVLDTRHFDANFGDRLLAALSDAGPLDERTDGLLIHGENFQALNLLQARYAGQVKCVYIDPPYNTGGDGFLYRDAYRHSSWMSMIHNRLELTNRLLHSQGTISVSIDENEVDNLQKVLDSVFPQRIGIVVVLTNPKGRSQDKFLATSHDYVVSSAKGSDVLLHGIVKSEEQLSQYSNGEDDDGPFRLLELRNTHRQFHRGNRPNLWYPIYADESTGGASLAYDRDSVEIYPVWPDGFEGCWTWGRDLAEKNIHLLVCRKTRGRWKVYRKDHAKKNGELATYIPKTIWNESEVRTETGQRILDDFFQSRRILDSPKPPALISKFVQLSTDKGKCILDYFAGSGTTGHAVIDLNRENGGERKYILVEMGDHFDTVMLPRLKKVVYSPDWKAGKPVARDKGVSHLIRYVRLESYEDTLDGLVLTPPDGDLLAGSVPALAEDYRLRYSLGAETAASPCLLGGAFTDPFAYSLSVVRDGARREMPADLPETFNLLLGLRVESRRRLAGVLAIAGHNAQGQRCLILWRNLETIDNDALEVWFVENRAHLPDALDLVYVNGDHTLNAIRQEGEAWTAETIEPLFRELMFDVAER